MIRSRIAPTPSGYLHIGNALNFVLTYTMVHRVGGSLRLRIDDIDAPRARAEYITDIFQTLEWMGLDWEDGPHSPEEHYRSYSQSLRAARYQDIIDKLNATGGTYACSCSRKELSQCRCRAKGLPLDTPDMAIRIVTPDDPVKVNDSRMGTVLISLQEEMHDFVIRRRDGIAAYQVASLADDIDYGINLIVRGEDLLTSTAAQLYLAAQTGSASFAETCFYHHALVSDTSGHKLSKSAGAMSVSAMRQSGMTRPDFYKLLSSYMGLKEPCRDLQELVHGGPGGEA